MLIFETESFALVTEEHVQNARIEHADTVKIDMKGTADSFFGFLGKQLSESRELRREIRAENREEEREIRRGFFKIFGYMAIGMFVLPPSCSLSA